MEPLNLPVLEAARVLGIGRSKLYEMLADPDNPLEAVKLGSRTLVRVASIRAFSDSLQRKGA